MREAIVRLGGDPQRVNPLAPAELVIDHSVQVDEYGAADSLAAQQRNRVQPQRRALHVPALGPDRVQQFQGGAAQHRHRAPGQHRAAGARHVRGRCRRRSCRAYPDTLVGTDSHTTMVNGLGVLGWGVGGIEAEAAMLGQPVTMLIPQVIGFKLTGSLPAGTTATDLVLTVTEMLRKKGRRRQVRRILRRRTAAACRSPTAPRSRTCRRSSARPAPSFPSMRKPSAISSSPAAPRRADRAGRGVCEGAGPVAHRRRAGGRLHRRRRARSRHRRALAGGPEAPAGPRAAALGEERLSSQREENGRGARPEESRRDRHGTRQARRQELRDQGRRGADRRDHQLHQHLEPRGDGRRRTARAQRAMPAGSTSKPWVKTSLAPGSRVVTDYLQEGGLAARARGARLLHRRLRLHHLYRQLRAAQARDLRGRQGRRRRSPARCCPATAISKGACIRRSR